MDRESTGITGLDELIQGGFPKSSVNLVTGGAGTGKTTFCVQYAFQGAEKGQNVLYITTEETKSEILLNAHQYGMKLDEYDNFEIRSIPPAQKVIGEIEWMLRENEYERVIMDSLSVFEMYKGDGNIRKYLRDLIQKFRNADCTVLLTTEIPETEEKALSRFGVAEFVVDGVVKLDFSTLGEEVERTIQVRKMRATGISGGEHQVEFAKNGLNVVQ